MKMWIALPNNFMSDGKCSNGYFCYGISTGSICPPLTREMIQDCLVWFDAEVTRRMDVGQVCTR